MRLFLQGLILLLQERIGIFQLRPALASGKGLGDYPSNTGVIYRAYMKVSINGDTPK